MSSILKKIKKLPDSPGVYLFLGKNRPTFGKTNRSRKILYVGKATSIHDRVKSYFNKDIAESRGPLIQKMLAEAKDISYKKTDSVLEALILEAALIKKHQPIYNTKEKSDKSFNYVIITREDFPRVLLVRERNLHHSNKPMKLEKLQAIFGPFPQGSILKNALKIIRKIFPFRDSCISPHKQHTNKLENVGMLLNKKKFPRISAFVPRSSAPKPCFGRQIGLCPGVCTGEISKKEYQNTIRNITLLFEGKKIALLRKLTKEMNGAAKKKEFEKAGKIKKTLFALKHIQDVSLIKQSQNYAEHTRNDAENSFQSSQELWNEKPMRIEAYDVAHMSGKHMVGVMTVVEEGAPQKNEYRKFNIKTVHAANDTAALKEMIERRLAHAEWPLPKLIVVDGGKAQVNAAESVLKKYEINPAIADGWIKIPIVGVVKDKRHRPKNILGDKRVISRHEKEILLANSESHRFAIAFHKKKRRIG